jgi:hypothetical protein
MAGAAGESGAAAVLPDTGPCKAAGWRYMRVAGREQAQLWAAPTLTISCGVGPYRLAGGAPRMAASLLLDIARSSGVVVEASYHTDDQGADGESWGEYDAPIDVTSARIGLSEGAAQQPFEFAGSILGPYGPVSIEAAGCALLRASLC